MTLYNPCSAWYKQCPYALLLHTLLVVYSFGNIELLRDGIEAKISQAASSAVGIYVLTDATKDEYRQRVRMAHSTWAYGHPILFVSGERDIALGIESVPCVEDGSMFAVSCKTINGLETALQLFPRARWLVRAVDDTFVFPENFEQELRVFDAREQVYIGAPSLTLLCSEPNHAPACGDVHAAGGAGIIFSRPLAEEFVRSKKVFLNSAGNTNDDIHVGHFLRYALDAHVHSLPGVKQEPRFERVLSGRFSIYQGRSIPPCPRPFPRPVYSTIEDWGSVYPWAPIDTKRLLMLHSSPQIWPDLKALQIVEKEAIEPTEGLSMMAYVRTEYKQGKALQPITSTHFQGMDALHICAYILGDRFSSFDMAANRDRFFSIAIPEDMVEEFNLTAAR